MSRVLVAKNQGWRLEGRWIQIHWRYCLTFSNIHQHCPVLGSRLYIWPLHASASLFISLDCYSPTLWQLPGINNKTNIKMSWYCFTVWSAFGLDFRAGGGQPVRFNRMFRRGTAVSVTDIWRGKRAECEVSLSLSKVTLKRGSDFTRRLFFLNALRQCRSDCYITDQPKLLIWATTPSWWKHWRSPGSSKKLQSHRCWRSRLVDWSD